MRNFLLSLVIFIFGFIVVFNIQYIRNNKSEVCINPPITIKDNIKELDYKRIQNGSAVAYDITVFSVKGYVFVSCNGEVAQVNMFYMNEVRPMTLEHYK